MAAAKCPGCGTEVDSEQDFCMECGEPIAGMKPKITASVQPIAKSPPSATVPAMPAAKRKAMVREEEPEPVRCPGCGTKTTARRCPGCGTPLRRDDDE